jgi:hypothetical protein
LEGEVLGGEDEAQVAYNVEKGEGEELDGGGTWDYIVQLV